MEEEGKSKGLKDRFEAYKEDAPNRRHRSCQDRLAKVLADGNVRYLMRAIRKLGCGGDSIQFGCEECGSPQKGDVAGAAFFQVADGKGKVAICEDRFWTTEKALKENVIHELVHAYDYARADLTEATCHEIACTEIRASTLSGECSFRNELARGNTGFLKQYQKCIRRRAGISISSHPNCQGAIGVQAINDVFDVCYRDREPFGRVPVKT